MISIIVAVSENNIIGSGSQIPWHLPRDFQYFKDTTLGHPIVMGRNTHLSIGKALPGRENIVLTLEDETFEGCTTARSIDEVLERAKAEEIFIAGGGQVYRQFLPHADKVYLTRVHTKSEGDITFPDLETTKWELTESKDFQKDEKNNFDMTFEVYEKRK